jgi:hypothetical protein
LRNPQRFNFLNYKIREDSTRYLLVKGIGAAMPLVFTGILAIFAYKSFQVANYGRLASDYNNIAGILNQKQTEIDKLNGIVSTYNSKRFVIHKEETKVLFSDVYFYFSGTGRNDYQIFKFRKTVAYGMNLPNAPDTFTIGNQKYFFVTERRFITSDFSVDSAVIYWDSLKTESIK